MPRVKLRAAIGERLRQARIDARLTQDHVAAEIGCTRQSVSTWESGRAMPPLDVVCALLILYAVSANQLLHGLSGIEELGRAVVDRARRSAADKGCEEISE